MAYDEVLAWRIRTLLVDEPTLTEKRMFGGLAFMVAGHMVVATNSRGELMVRTAPADRDHPYLVQAQPVVMRGRELAGWLNLPSAAIADGETLAAVVAHGLRFVRTLPAS